MEDEEEREGEGIPNAFGLYPGCIIIVFLLVLLEAGEGRVGVNLIALLLQDNCIPIVSLLEGDDEEEEGAGEYIIIVVCIHIVSLRSYGIPIGGGGREGRRPYCIPIVFLLEEWEGMVGWHILVLLLYPYCSCIEFLLRSC